MELLSTLPTGAPADIRTLASDFRVPLWEMRDLLADLGRRYGIALSPVSAIVPRRARELVDRDCLEYWQRVYRN